MRSDLVRFRVVEGEFCAGTCGRKRTGRWIKPGEWAWRLREALGAGRLGPSIWCQRCKGRARGVNEA